LHLTFADNLIPQAAKLLLSQTTSDHSVSDDVQSDPEDYDFSGDESDSDPEANGLVSDYTFPENFVDSSSYVDYGKA